MKRYVFGLIILLFSCKEKEVNTPTTLFTLLPSTETNIDFSNDLTEGPNTNILIYEYFYNGGGVAAGDINNDGLIDLYFTSNMGGNKLYLNQGSMKFKDITKQSGAMGRIGPWKTGVTMADVNGDGHLDIHVSYSGMLPEPKRNSQLFINDGNLHFTDKAAEYGLANSAFSNQTYFFDYDLDGDLDALQLNHNPQAMPVLNEVGTASILKTIDPFIGIKLFRQADNKFVDVTATAGIGSSALTYGLAAGISDINNDGWPDFYISNDYAVPDYLYINNKNGTFTDRLSEQVGHNSQFSMGNAVEDVNNDGLQDIYTLDMLPEDNRRQKILLAPDNYGKFDFNVKVGFGYQYMRNMLQLNNGNNTFSEAGQLAGISNTDWSWSPLFADFNNDGWKDLLVTNGYFRDYTNLDFIKYMDDFVKVKGRLKREDVLEIIKKMPSSNVVNYAFENRGGASFTDKTKEWGMYRSSSSNGAAYADLDNDGDLDVVVNNINEKAFVYKNNTEQDTSRSYLSVVLKGSSKNTNGIGAKVMLSSGGSKQYREQMPTRGYLSTVSHVLHFGLKRGNVIDSLLVTWPGGKQQLLRNVNLDQQVILKEAEADLDVFSKNPGTLFVKADSPIRHTDTSADVNDFKRQPLLINPLSFAGPCLVKADVNNDGLDDVFVGGSGAIFIQQKNSTFTKKVIDKDNQCEDADAIFFDANGDHHPDLYVASGGYHNFAEHDNLLQDRLYINDGKGNFKRIANALPEMLSSKSTVSAGDVDNDGDLDLFIGGRCIPGRYPETPRSFLLINDGSGTFTDETPEDIRELGMITDAVWLDVNNDNRQDLLVVGEWMAPTILVNDKSTLRRDDTDFINRQSGWWNCIAAGDFNKDGKTDFVLGNMGTNTQFSISPEKPAELYFTDFDKNGSVDPLFCYYIQGKSYPYVTRDELLEQIGSFRKKYTNYESYSNVAMNDLFSAEDLKKFKVLKANRLQTTLYLSDNNTYRAIDLPKEVQYSPIYSILVLDYNKDGNDDLLLTGNISRSKLRLGKFDANYGVLLKGNGQGDFSYIPQTVSGFEIRGDVRSTIMLNDLLMFGISGGPISAYTFAK